jgi:uncharacterized protein (DUF2267 family)
MAELGLPIFDRTVQETNSWLQFIGDELGKHDREQAYHALRATLFTLRDRLPVALVSSLGAQLPLLIRGIFYEGFDAANQPESYRTREEWDARINDAYNHPGYSAKPEAITHAVFACLDAYLDRGLIEKVFSALPESVRELWVEVPETVAHS